MRPLDVLSAELSEVLPGYEDRRGQQAMAEAVDRALRTERHLLVEAGTGTGKTLAYLVPAILSNRKVVISTATHALQEQILMKDLPVVTQLLGRLGVPVRAAAMKGLSNYVCRRRLSEALGENPTDGSLLRIESWSKESESGDRAELSTLRETDPAWGSVLSSTDTRIGATCTYYDSCFVTRMRREAEDAQIVVVNHHLFFADLALRNGPRGEYASALPPYDAVIFDEAHQLESVATDFFGARVTQTRCENLARDAERALVAEQGPLGNNSRDKLLFDMTGEAAKRFFAALGGARSGVDRRALLASDYDEAVVGAEGRLATCLKALTALGLSSKTEGMMQVARRASELRDTLERIRKAAEGTEESAWIEVKDRAVSIGMSPVELGPLLRSALFDRVSSVILTSATLSTSIAGEPSFHYVRGRLGVPEVADECVVPSPFAFETHALLYTPRDLPPPSDPAFEAAAVPRIRELIDITKGGAFVLTTSVRAMRGFAEALRREPSGHTILVQGESPKHVLLDRFRADGNAVLVATMSFWEGVDVPGHALRLVIMDKIPFAVPTDPVLLARSRRIEAEGGNPFTELSLPQAAITLKQGFGRLIRNQDDVGIVAILDRRLMAMGYGRVLLGSLPPARRATKLPEVRAFWDRNAPPAAVP